MANANAPEKMLSSTELYNNPWWKFCLHDYIPVSVYMVFMQTDSSFLADFTENLYNQEYFQSDNSVRTQ